MAISAHSEMTNCVSVYAYVYVYRNEYAYMYISIWVFVFVFYILEKRDMGGLFLTEIIIEARRISRHSKKKGNMRSICYFFHETGGVCTQQEVLLNFKTITKKV